MSANDSEGLFLALETNRDSSANLWGLVFVVVSSPASGNSCTGGEAADDPGIRGVPQKVEDHRSLWGLLMALTSSGGQWNSGRMAEIIVGESLD